MVRKCTKPNVLQKRRDFEANIFLFCFSLALLFSMATFVYFSKGL